jgi:hypothetical protein
MTTLRHRLDKLEASAARGVVKPTLMIGEGDDPVVAWARQHRAPYPGDDNVFLIVLCGVKPERRDDGV